MAKRRTTLFLDEHADAAARELARRYGCSVSEAIRRSVVSQRDTENAVPRHIRNERARTLKQLFDLFDGHDAAEEVRRLKLEDSSF